MWFIVRNKVKDLKLNNSSEYEYIVTASGDSESKAPKGLLIVGGIFLAIIIFGGLISAVALPAYYKYVSKSRYTAVTYVADFLKKQVELCMLDLGTVDFAPNQPKIVDTTINPLGCSNLKKNSGKNWKLLEPKAVSSLYVKDVVIDANGVITAYGGSTHGLDGATYQLVPYNGDKDDGTTIWKLNEEGSTCIALGLC
jgi:Tfp pilus assembly major pilin PilA